MADDRLTTSDIGVLLTLMIEARPASNVELKERHRLSLDGSQRRKLNELKLVTSEKVGRSFVHELTDAGWRRCREELLPPREPLKGVISAARLEAVLVSIGRYLDRADLTAADFFQTPADKPVDDVSVDDAILAAYQKAPKGSSGWVSLRIVRPLVGDLPRDDVDEALVRLNRQRTISLAPEENQKTLTEGDVDAAVMIGGRAYHLILVDEQ